MLFVFFISSSSLLEVCAGCRGCLLVRQSFFHDDSKNFTDIGGGVTGCRGFHSSFRPTYGGLSLNMGMVTFSLLLLVVTQLLFLIVLVFSFADVSTTMILTPGPVIDFLKSNQNARDARSIDWLKVIKGYPQHFFPINLVT